MASRNIFDEMTAVLFNPENLDVLNPDCDFVCPSSLNLVSLMRYCQTWEEPPYVHEAEYGTQWSSIPPNSSRTHARDISHRPINKIVNANYHSSIQIHFQIKMLSMSHSMVLAATGYVEHGLSMHLCTVGQCQLGHTYLHRPSHIQTVFS